MSMCHEPRLTSVPVFTLHCGAFTDELPAAETERLLAHCTAAEPAVEFLALPKSAWSQSFPFY